MREHSEDYIWNYKLQFGDWVALDAEEGSYFGGHAALGRLVNLHIPKPLFKESIGVRQIACRPAEYLGVPRPAKPLVTLRAVGGHIKREESM